MSVCCECRVLAGTVLCDELIPQPEVSYRLWRVVVSDLEPTRMGGVGTLGSVASNKSISFIMCTPINLILILIHMGLRLYFI
jgi:hypothetical protein